MKFALSLVLVLVSVLFPSDAIVFSVVVGCVDQDLAFCVRQTTDDGYIVAAQSEAVDSGGTRSKNAWILKFDLTGRREWDRTLGEAKVDDAAFCIQHVRDGGYVIAGTTASWGAWYPLTWIMKLDERGDSVWSRVYEGPIVSSARSIRQTEDGGYIAAGKGGENVLKMDSLGMKEWGARIGWMFNAVEPTRDGGYILTGDSVYRPLDWGYIPALVIVKLDARGEVEWTAPGGKALPGRGWSVQQTVDGGYVVAGDSIGFESATDSFTHLQVWKLDRGGAVEWRYHGEKYSSAQSIQQTSDGGYIATGAVTDGGFGLDIPVLKLDRNGKRQWQKEHGIPGGWEYASSIHQTRDGGYIVVGQTDSYGAGHYDVWLLKLDEQGNGPVPSGISSGKNDRSGIAMPPWAHPNPMRDEITISFHVADPSYVSVSIFAVNGTMVRRLPREMRVNGLQSMQWNGRADNGDAVPAGLYLYRVEAGSQTGTGKILVIR